MTTPKMIPGQVEMVSVEWLMNNLTHSVDGYSYDGGLNYEGMIKNKGGDCHFGNILHTITTVGFRVPIVVDLVYSGSGTLTLGNGHHRMTAAILLVLESIPVYWAENNYMSSDKSDTEELLYDEGRFEGAGDLVYRVC